MSEPGTPKGLPKTEVEFRADSINSLVDLRSFAAELMSAVKADKVEKERYENFVRLLTTALKTNEDPTSETLEELKGSWAEAVRRKIKKSNPKTTTKKTVKKAVKKSSDGVREELKKPADGSISPEDLERTLERLDKLVAVRKARREKLNLSDAEVTTESENYKAIRYEIIKIRNRLNKLKEGKEVNPKEVADLKAGLLNHLAEYRAEMKGYEKDGGKENGPLVLGDDDRVYGKEISPEELQGLVNNYERATEVNDKINTATALVQSEIADLKHTFSTFKSDNENAKKQVESAIDSLSDRLNSFITVLNSSEDPTVEKIDRLTKAVREYLARTHELIGLQNQRYEESGGEVSELIPELQQQLGLMEGSDEEVSDESYNRFADLVSSQHSELLAAIRGNEYLSDEFRDRLIDRAMKARSEYVTATGNLEADKDPSKATASVVSGKMSSVLDKWQFDYYEIMNQVSLEYQAWQEAKALHRESRKKYHEELARVQEANRTGVLALFGRKENTDKLEELGKEFERTEQKYISALDAYKAFKRQNTPDISLFNNPADIKEDDKASVDMSVEAREQRYEKSKLKTLGAWEGKALATLESPKGHKVWERMAAAHGKFRNLPWYVRYSVGAGVIVGTPVAMAALSGAGTMAAGVAAGSAGLRWGLSTGFGGVVGSLSFSKWFSERKWKKEQSKVDTAKEAADNARTNVLESKDKGVTVIAFRELIRQRNVDLAQAIYNQKIRSARQGALGGALVGAALGGGLRAGLNSLADSAVDVAAGPMTMADMKDIYGIDSGVAIPPDSLVQPEVGSIDFDPAPIAPVDHSFTPDAITESAPQTAMPGGGEPPVQPVETPGVQIGPKVFPLPETDPIAVQSIPPIPEPPTEPISNMNVVESVPEPAPQATVESVPIPQTETVPEPIPRVTFGEPVPIPVEPIPQSVEQLVTIPEEYGGIDTLSETVFEHFKAGDIRGLPEGMTKAEFLNKFYAAVEALDNNEAVMARMSVNGSPNLMDMDLVYKDAQYNIQPIIEHMNGASVSEIEAGTAAVTPAVSEVPPVAPTAEVASEIPPIAPDTPVLGVTPEVSDVPSVAGEAGIGVASEVPPVATDAPVLGGVPEGNVDIAPEVMTPEVSPEVAPAVPPVAEDAPTLGATVAPEATPESVIRVNETVSAQELSMTNRVPILADQYKVMDPTEAARELAGQDLNTYDMAKVIRRIGSFEPSQANEIISALPIDQKTDVITLFQSDLLVTAGFNRLDAAVENSLVEELVDRYDQIPVGERAGLAELLVQRETFYSQLNSVFGVERGVDGFRSLHGVEVGQLNYGDLKTPEMQNFAQRFVESLEQFDVIKSHDIDFGQALEETMTDGKVVVLENGVQVSGADGYGRFIAFESSPGTESVIPEAPVEPVPVSPEVDADEGVLASAADEFRERLNDPSLQLTPDQLAQLINNREEFIAALENMGGFDNSGVIAAMNNEVPVADLITTIENGQLAEWLTENGVEGNAIPNLLTEMNSRGLLDGHESLYDAIEAAKAQDWIRTGVNGEPQLRKASWLFGNQGNWGNVSA